MAAQPPDWWSKLHLGPWASFSHTQNVSHAVHSTSLVSFRSILGLLNIKPRVRVPRLFVSHRSTAVAAALEMAFSFVWMLLAVGLLLAVVYPLMESMNALKSPARDRVQQWLTYWIILSLLVTAETLSKSITHWGYVYSVLRLCFITWLVLPYTNGARVVYQTLLEPLLGYAGVSQGRMIIRGDKLKGISGVGLRGEEEEQREKLLEGEREGRKQGEREEAEERGGEREEEEKMRGGEEGEEERKVGGRKEEDRKGGGRKEEEERVSEWDEGRLDHQLLSVAARQSKAVKLALLTMLKSFEMDEEEKQEASESQGTQEPSESLSKGQGSSFSSLSKGTLRTRKLSFAQAASSQGENVPHIKEEPVSLEKVHGDKGSAAMKLRDEAQTPHFEGPGSSLAFDSPMGGQQLGYGTPEESSESAFGSCGVRSGRRSSVGSSYPPS